MYGIFQPNEEEVRVGQIPEEEDDLSIALRLSREEAQKMREAMSEEEEMMRRVMELSVVEK